MSKGCLVNECGELVTKLANLWHTANASGAIASTDNEVQSVIGALVDLLGAGNQCPLGACKKSTDAYSKLTPRERDVLYWLACGKSISDVGTVMGISKATVRTYIQRILEKLEVSNRTHAVTLALTYGIIKV